ncbi:O-antigen ligase family protein [Paenibacillus aquistagni]|uniref:O-antigen ligase n=1 Tax=Paenibacillus aquistagni TaxID=1852522 RepID=A0A1X7KZA8_9BACL|nr:O-antigen ligase family protein [Paenibacillus aquistagni]SMG46523.1 O-antigen ligase [Paenibacillus aquistagni]
MSTYGYSTTKNSKTSDGLQLYWLLLGLVTLFLFWASFRVALFNGQDQAFEQSIYISILWSSLISILTIILIEKNSKWIQITLSSIIVFLLPLSYLISLISSASQYLAINMLLITLMYALFFITSQVLSQHTTVNKLLTYVITTIAYIIVFFGLFHWLGNGPLITTLVKWLGSPTISSGAYKDAVMVDSNGARLTSVFQYANTYAAYLMAFLFVAAFLIGKSRSWWSKFIHGFMLVPIILSIFLTLSRGGLVLLPVVFVLLLVFLKPYRQLMWILHLAVSGIVTIIILNPVTDLGLQLQSAFSVSQSLTGWLYILIGSAVSGGISLALEKWVSPALEKATGNLSNKKWGNFLIPVGGIVLGALLLFVLVGTSAKNILPENIQTRLENINFEQHSVLERLTFYKDAMKVVKDYPIIGAGGGAWSALYEQYQNNPYTSRQAHNFYLQYLIETGILGFVIFAAFLIYIFVQYIRGYIKVNEEKRSEHFVYFIIAASILIHSILDFNMSYAYIGVLVFICLGGMTASIESKPFKLKIKPKTLRTVYSATIGVISVVLLIVSGLFISATNSFIEAQELREVTNNYNELVAPLNKALIIRGNHPDYAIEKATLLTQVYRQSQSDEFYQEAEKTIHTAIKTDPSNKRLLMTLNSLYQSKKLDQDIFRVYEANAYRFPWDISWYEQYMHIGIQLAYNAPDSATRKTYIDTVLNSLDHINKGIKHLRTLPEGQFQGKAFEITPNVALRAGQAYYMQGQTQEAYGMIKSHLQDDLSNVINVEMMTWYLAASEKLGMNDEDHFNKLVEVDENAKDSIGRIVTKKF